MTVFVDTLKNVGNCDELDKRYGANEWVYVGRGGFYGKRKLNRSILANDTKLKKGEIPGTATKAFRIWLWERIQADDPAVMAELRRISCVKAVVCHCAPGAKTCHGHVIVRAARYVAQRDTNDSIDMT